MKTIALTTLAAAAGLATASPFMSTGLTEYTVDNAGVATSSMVIDISGIDSWDFQGAAGNTWLHLNVGATAVITGISWNVNLSTVGASWASEATLGFEAQINLAPGAADGFSVSNANYNSGGVVDISDAGLPNITVSADGILDIEFFDSFDDVAGAADAQWLANSSITIVGQNIVPTPGSLAVLGLGGLVAGRRRR